MYMRNIFHIDTTLFCYWCLIVYIFYKIKVELLSGRLNRFQSRNTFFFQAEIDRYPYHFRCFRPDNILNVTFL